MNQLTAQKTVLYVDKNYLPNTDGYERGMFIREGLEKKYALIIRRNLNSQVIDFIRQSFSSTKFDAMITNMPYQESAAYVSRFNEFMNVRNCYKESLNILREVKKTIDMPIIIYTGAGDSPAVNGVFLSVADHVVHKSMSSKQDFKEIDAAMEKLLRKYKDICSQDKGPDIKFKEGYTTTQVQVNCNGGMDLSFLATILYEGKNFPGEIVFEALGNAQEKKRIYNGKKFFDFVTPPVIEEGQHLTICVEGTGEEAQRKARRLYAAFSSRYAFAMDLNRFETEKSQA